jgi:predicted GNAT family acetyltransferase
MPVEVRKAPDRSRYELVEDDTVVAIAEYEEHGDVVVFPHTVVDPIRRGEGLGEQLVRGAMDDVRTSGRKVVPACWFVADFLDAHTDYADLRA